MKSLPFAPTIIEHAACLINCTPSAAAQNSGLMAKAHIEAFRQYDHPFITIGIDVYNIEAQALGCEVRFYTDNSIPGIVTHPYNLEDDPALLRFSSEKGRIQLILDAACMVKKAVGDKTAVSIGICGPFSILVELLGFDVVIDALIDDDNIDEIKRILLFLEALLLYQKDYCDLITSKGLGLTVFDSWASLPLISPGIYKKYAAPFQKKLLEHLKLAGLQTQPLIIGGDSQKIVDFMLDTGTTLLVSDYNAPLIMYAEKAREYGVVLRANIDPKKIWSGDWEYISSRINEIYSAAKIYPKIIIGTGVMPYDVSIDNILRTKKMAGSLSRGRFCCQHM